MIKDPRRSVNAINNRVTVSLPLTSMDVDYLKRSLQLSVEDLGDIDLSAKSGGVVLQYNADAKKWQAVKTLTNLAPNMVDGGEF